MSTLVPVDPSKIHNGPGVLRLAPVGSDLPAMVAAGGTYAADVWPVAWLKLGPTIDGITRSTSTEQEAFYVAEDLEPVFNPITSQSTTISFTLVEDTIRTLKAAMNGGTVTTLSGTGASASTAFSPPLLGAQNSVMIGWESDDQTQRALYYNCLQTGSPEPQRNKGNNYVQYALTFTVQKANPSVSVTSWREFYAGTPGTLV